MQEKTFFNRFKSRLFPITNSDEIPTHEPTPELATEPTKHNKSKLKLEQRFMNEGEKDIDGQIFWNYFRY